MRYLAIECPASRGTWSCHAVPEIMGKPVPIGATVVYDAALAAAGVLVAADLDTWEAYEVPGDYSSPAAVCAAWATVRMDGTNPKPIARGQYRYDEDGAAPVSVGVVMLTEGGR